ncbi:MAG: NeuD/PglB/VioB family sugar acetyltransferase [Pseudomonadota bacterium]
MGTEKRSGYLIIGGGGFGQELYGLLSETGWPVAGFVDTHETEVIRSTGRPYLGTDDELERLRSRCTGAFIALGALEKRHRIFEHLKALDYAVPRFIHPRAYVSGTAAVQDGALVYPHATLHHNVGVGRCVLVNSNVSVGHDTICGDFTTLNPNAAVAGRVAIGSRVMVGMGAAIIENLSVCDDAVIGAGAVVAAAITTPGVYVGVPARKRQ